MRRYVASVLAAVVALRGRLRRHGAGRVRRAAGGWVPPDDTIVDISGDAANGFEIHHYDGSALFPPTDSEARAECNEYATRVDAGPLPHRGPHLVPRPGRDPDRRCAGHTHRGEPAAASGTLSGPLTVGPVWQDRRHGGRAVRPRLAPRPHLA